MQVTINVLISFSLISLLAVSFSLIFSTAKFFAISNAAIVTASPYFILLSTNNLELPFIIAVPFAIILAACVGIICEMLIYRNLRSRKAPPLSLFIASIGLYIMLQNIISLFFGDDIKIINNEPVVVGQQIFGAYITKVQLISCGICALLLFLVDVFLKRTMTGKSIRAVASNAELCNIYGLNSNKIILVAFAISSTLAGTVGILSAMDTNMTPTFGFDLLLYGIVAMIIGGVGNTFGSIAGALLVSTAQHLAAYYIDTNWMDAVTYVILILFLIWKPLGFSGTYLKKIEI